MPVALSVTRNCRTHGTNITSQTYRYEQADSITRDPVLVELWVTTTRHAPDCRPRHDYERAGRFATYHELVVREPLLLHDPGCQQLCLWRVRVSQQVQLVLPVPTLLQLLLVLLLIGLWRGACMTRRFIKAYTCLISR